MKIKPWTLSAIVGLFQISAPLHAGDYDQALSVLSRAFPKVRTVGVFYDGYGTLLNLMEFETSAYKEFGLSIKLVPLNPKERITVESLRTLCTRNGIHAILLLDGDPLVQPSSPAGRALIGQAGRIPVAGIREEWLQAGAWFVVGPSTKGLKIRPKLPDEKALEALKALEAEFRSGKP